VLRRWNSLGKEHVDPDHRDEDADRHQKKQGEGCQEVQDQEPFEDPGRRSLQNGPEGQKPAAHSQAFPHAGFEDFCGRGSLACFSRQDIGISGTPVGASADILKAIAAKQDMGCRSWTAPQ